METLPACRLCAPSSVLQRRQLAAPMHSVLATSYPRHMRLMCLCSPAGGPKNHFPRLHPPRFTLLATACAACRRAFDCLETIERSFSFEMTFHLFGHPNAMNVFLAIYYVITFVLASSTCSLWVFSFPFVPFKDSGLKCICDPGLPFFLIFHFPRVAADLKRTGKDPSCTVSSIVMYHVSFVNCVCFTVLC